MVVSAGSFLMGLPGALGQQQVAEKGTWRSTARLHDESNGLSHAWGGGGGG